MHTKRRGRARRARLQPMVHPGLPRQRGRVAVEAAVHDQRAAVCERADQPARRRAANRVQRQARQRGQRRGCVQLRLRAGLH